MTLHTDTADTGATPMSALPKCPRSKRGEGCLNGPDHNGVCCQVIPAGQPIGFGVFLRDPKEGHWDIYTKQGRAFCIRGSTGDHIVRDERIDDARPNPRESMGFKTVTAAMAWCADELMHPKPAPPEDGQ